MKVEEHGFQLVEGKTTDILPLTISGLCVSCANVSAGYYSPHKDEEFTVVSDLMQSLAYIEELLSSLRRRFPHLYISETQKHIEQLLI